MFGAVLVRFGFLDAFVLLFVLHLSTYIVRNRLNCNCPIVIDNGRFLENEFVQLYKKCERRAVRI